MAEFKLGRIRFVYQGNWQASHIYVVDDVVTTGGKSYICILNHTSSSLFNTDQTALPTKWNLVADGTAWTGNWLPTHYYSKGDQVKYGGTVYICNEAHTSATNTSPSYFGLEQDDEKWDTFATNFFWAGEWDTSTKYRLRDLVSYGGVTYVCNDAHISASDITNGLENDIGKWDVFNEGVKYLGPWDDADVRYKLNDVVKYGADLWICIDPHTSTDPFDDTKWSVFVNGFQFESSWSSGGTYQIGDVVTYGGYSYICKQNHDTSKIPSTETAYWDVYTTGFNFRSDWNSAFSYKVGDVVRLGGYTYLALVDNAVASVNATATTVSSNLTRPNQITCGSTAGLVANLPITFSGTTFGNIITGTTYYVKTVVDATHFTICQAVGQPVFALTTATGTTTGTTNPKPPFATFWARLNTGFKWNPRSETYTSVAGTNIVGTGSSATFNVVRSGTVYVITKNLSGSNYAINDTIKILGSALGGISPANDTIITVTGVNSGAITTISSTGISSTWSASITYVLGDVTFFGASSYVCVSAHISELANRPDADTLAEYWNLLASGSESAVLTTKGDTFFYGLNGPQRLPVGTDGQVLRVTDGYPSWSYYGIINNLVYVASTGTDSNEPGYGLTVDKPWKTVRYACERIEAGYQNIKAAELIAKNKQFLMKEVTNWVDYTYTVTISAASSTVFTVDSTANLLANMPIKFSGTVGGVTAGTTYFVKAIANGTTFSISTTSGGNALTLSAGSGSMTGSLVYDKTFCERDTGLIVEGVVFDLTHGGNQQTTLAALAYYTTAGNAYINSNFGTQIIETVAAYAYLNTLIGNVLNNTAPANNYQTLNGVTPVAGQIIDATLTAEIGTATIVTNLINIIKNGLTAGSATAIPTAIQPNTTISVKTGTFTEVLPIVVPKNTAVVGDELRGTVIQPKTAIANLIGDKAKTTSALNRIKSIVPTLLSNATVAKTTGNTETQSYLYSSIDNTGSARITSNLSAMSNILANGISAAPAFVTPDPTSYDTGYLNARRLVVANKQFLKDEIAAYMNINQNSTWTGLGTAGQAKCTRDIGYIVDALQYDLTYGGNLATVIAARSYYSYGTFVEPAGEKTAALAVQTYLKTIIDDIVIGNAITRTSGNTTVQNVSGTAGSAGAATFAQARIQEMYDTINTGTTPSTLAPSTAWVAASLTTANNTIQLEKSFMQEDGVAWITSNFPTLVFNATTCSRDLGYIIDALCYDMMFGSNFLSVWNAMSYYRALTSTQVVIASQLQPTIGVVSYVGGLVKGITSGNTSTVGNMIVIDRVKNSAELMYDIVNNGISNVPALVLTSPTGYNTTYLAGYGDAKAQIVQNYQFIKDEISAYLNTYYNAVWVALGADGQATCQRDVGYILDALQYDMTYGGNVQSLITGASYYSFYQLVIASTEKTATIAAYGRLKTIVGQIVVKTSVTRTSGNTTTQTTTGTAGSAGSATFAEARMQDVINWVTNGTAPSSIAPSITWTSTALQQSFASLQAAKTEIQADAVAWVKRFFHSMNFNSSTCSRDAGLIVDALSYDMVFNSNFNSITVGRSYYRTQSAVVLASQKDAELGAINFIKYKAKTAAASGAVARASNIIDDITGFIKGGAVPRFRWPDFTGIDAENALGAKLIWQNKEFIKAELIQYIATNYPAVVYSKEICKRDVGYIIDALRYDLTYGGHSASKQAGISYYSRLTSAFEIAAGEKAATLAAYAVLKTLVQAIGSGSAYSALQNIVSRVTGSAGDANTSTAVGALVDVITNIIDLGITSGVPKITITAVASGTTFTSGTHGLSVGDEIIPQTTPSSGSGGYGLVADTIYYVASVPLGTTFTLAATFGGAAITTFTNGTGLTLAAEKTNLPSTSWVDASLITQYTALSASKAATKAAVISYIATNYPTLTYNSTTCARDVGYIMDAVGYDLMFNSNFKSVKAGMSYYQAQAALVVGSQKTATVAAFNYLKTQIATTLITSATATARANANMDAVINILSNGIGETPEVYGTNTYNNTLGTIKGAEILRANKEFLAYEATAWITATFTGTVTGTATSGSLITTSAPHNLGVGDPVKFTATTVTTTVTAVTISSDGVRPNQLTVGTTSGMVVGMPIVVSGIALSNLTSGTYYVKTIPDSTHITVSSSYNGSVYAITSSASGGSMGATVGGIFGNLAINTTYYVLTAPSYTTFTIATTATGTSPVSLSLANGVATVTYEYDAASCRRDMRTYIDALVYDLQYTGNYRALRAAQLYNNAVGGSTLSDMFRIRNGTGLRNCTLTGLNGILTNANQYGTKRPTAGAFVALDPGFGPNDRNVWITSRSHYSQNVTMFGTGCTGAKIDAALHTSGNKSMVKNDFTTIISDGIGVWCTGSGSLTELVSVFNYYGYAGYMAELGGRIRATNGNSSYGTYGVIAEGVDTYETPIYATVNNRSFQAQITSTITDVENKILRFEYSNAGQGYTNTVHTISGSGYNATATADEFRDAAAFETRIIDNNDGNGVGGTSYVTASNASQGGSAGLITIAATDTNLSAAYVGMRVQITAGTGVGQYANILSYNSGTKEALVYKDSFTTVTVTGSTTTVLQASAFAVSTLYVNMPIYFNATTAGVLTANTLYYIESIPSSTTFKVKVGTGGSAITGLTATSGQTISLYAAGWDHAIPGYTITNALDLTSAYIIEPRISYSTPGYTYTSQTMSATAQWQSAAYGNGKYVAIANGSTASSYSADGKTWAATGALTTSTMTAVAYGGGEGAVGTAVVGGLGGSGAVLTAVIGTGDFATQVVSVTVVNGGTGYTTPPTIVFTATSGGSGATGTATVLNGAIASVIMSIPGSGYNAAPTVTAATDRVTGITVNNWGKSYFSTPAVTISTPGGVSTSTWVATTSVTTGMYLITLVDFNIYYVTAGGTTGSTKPTHTSGTQGNGGATLQYYGTRAVATATLTNAGVSGYTISINGVGYTTTPTVTITDSASRFVAIANGAVNSCYHDLTLPAGAWSAGGSTGKTDLVSITYGNGVYVAVGGTSGTASCVTSSDAGSTWVSRSITALGATSYSSVAFGNGAFVAVQTGGVQTSYSLNGTTWVAGGNLPASTTWTSVGYGNGRFVALAVTGAVAYSVDKGLTWVAAPTATGTTVSVLNSSYAWQRVKYGQGLFFVIATGSVGATSPDGINWTTVNMPSSSNWKALTFGNSNGNPLWIAASNTSGTIGASFYTGAKALGRVKVASGIVTEIRMIEPGSSYPKGTVTNTTVTTNYITVNNTVNLVDSQPVEFFGTGIGNLTVGTTYYVIGATINSTQFKVSATAGSATAVVLSTATSSGSNLTYRAGPIVTITDPNKVKSVTTRVRLGDGALGNPSFSDRGTNNTTATSSTQGDGFSDLYQPSTFISVSGLYSLPTAGANVEFANIPGVWFKLVAVTNVLGLAGNYSAQFQINPSLTVLNAPTHGVAITTRLKYSQVRLTGHDFLYIGTGNQTQTNYPYVDPTTASQSRQSNSSGGGRVFFTSTDQDGNFNVGNLFGVQQATGTATLNASAFNLAGLQSLQLGAVSLGVGSAVITQFSTDPYFTANSDSVVPTQRAIKSYITAQIGGGSSSLNVNTLTAGVLYLANNSISTTTGVQINVTSKMNFIGGIDGAPVALGFFMQR